MKFRWNNKNTQSFNVIIGKTAPYGSKVVLRHYHYMSDPKLVPGFVSLKIISCSYHACKTQLYMTWGYKIKDAYNHPRYGKIFNNFLDDRTNDDEYEHTKRKVLCVNVTNIKLSFYQ